MSMNPWGAAAPAAAPIKLHDVMDEELAAKLQREEEEQWERDIAAQFGDSGNVGWCFVEVPSADCEFGGVMSVIQQEIHIEEQDGDPNDPDYALALELQAQEAEEYNRLRRQEASSMERIQVMADDGPHRSRPMGHYLPPRTPSRRPFARYGSSASSGTGFSMRIHEEEYYAYEMEGGVLVAGDSADSSDSHHLQDDFRGSSANATAHEDGDAETDEGGGAEDPGDEEDEEEEEMYLDDDCGLPLRKFHALDITLRSGGDRKHPRSGGGSASPYRS